MSLSIWEGKKAERVAAALENLARGGDPVAIDNTFAAMLTGDNTTQIFRQWWDLSNDGVSTRYERLERWFTMLAKVWSGKKYTLRYYNASASSSSVMTPLDDLADKSAAQLCTKDTVPVADWADEDPMTWYTRFNGLSLADGTMNILAVEGVDAEFDKTGNTAPVYAVSLALWKREWSNGDYEYKSWATVNHGGYAPYAGDVDPENNKRAMTWHPALPGGFDNQGRIGSGVGQKPYNRKSGNQSIASARTIDAYEGLWNDSDQIWVLDMWQLRHFNIENSDICNGCQSYNFTYTAAVSETGVNRVIVTTAQAANILVGSNIMIGTNASADRNVASSFSIADNATVLSIEEITIDGTTYAAVNVDTDSTFDTTAGTTQIMSAPWNSGVTEAIPDHKDGALYHLTDGKSPMRVQGVEMMSGAYDIGLDPLYNITNFDSTAKTGDYEVFECRDSEHLAGSITSNYQATGITYIGVAQGWNWVKAFMKTKLAVLFPSLFGGSSSTYYKSGFLGTYSAGVRCPWRSGALAGNSYCGLACEPGNSSPSDVYWYGRGRLGGSGKKRGEWTA